MTGRLDLVDVVTVVAVDIPSADVTDALPPLSEAVVVVAAVIVGVVVALECS